MGIKIPAPHGFTPSEEFFLLIDASISQSAARETLHTKLSAVASSVSTRKALVEMLPEFEKYLPAEAGTAANLPAVANVLTDFMLAGWPKGSEKTAATV